MPHLNEPLLVEAWIKHHGCVDHRLVVVTSTYHVSGAVAYACEGPVGGTLLCKVDSGAIKFLKYKVVLARFLLQYAKYALLLSTYQCC